VSWRYYCIFLKKWQAIGMEIRMNKNIGETPLEMLGRLRIERPDLESERMTYAGRLDPMASGEMIVLVGDSVHDKEKYQNLDKIYEFQVMFGVATDSNDVLGVITETSEKTPEDSAIEISLREFLARQKFPQTYPPYSSKPVDGKPLWQWAREGRLSEIEMPTHDVQIHEIELLNYETKNVVNIHSDIIKNIGLVNGDFRQSEAVQSWQKYFTELKTDQIHIATIRAHVSGGFYVRQFAVDLAKKLGTVGCVIGIKRVSIGGIGDIMQSYGN